MKTDRNEQIARLFQDHAAAVARAVTANTGGASTADIEDACTTAWTVLVRRTDIDVTDPAVVRFLIVVATREAWKLVQRQTDRPTFDPQDAPEIASDAPDALQVILDRETLALIGTLPERQREVVTLRAQGLGRDEIARITGWTLRTVDRQTYRALARLRELRE